MNVNRKKILEQAVHDCYVEMYAKAQPMADYDALIAENKAGKINEDKDGKVYERHYLSLEEHQYILNKYIDAYNIKSEWYDHVDVVQEYLKDGGYETVYSNDKYPNEHTRKDKSLKELIEKYLEDNFGTSENSIADDITKIVMDKIEKCKNYYRFNEEENSFRFTMTLGHAPTSNKETVKQWWKDHYNEDIKIEDRNPLLFYDMDEYGDDFEEIMKDEYGENWKEYWDNEYNKTKLNKNE